jgi:hypothetical protein
MLKKYKKSGIPPLDLFNVAAYRNDTFFAAYFKKISPVFVIILEEFFY